MFSSIDACDKIYPILVGTANMAVVLVLSSQCDSHVVFVCRAGEEKGAFFLALT